MGVWDLIPMPNRGLGSCEKSLIRPDLWAILPFYVNSCIVIANEILFYLWTNNL